MTNETKLTVFVTRWVESYVWMIWSRLNLQISDIFYREPNENFLIINSLYPTFSMSNLPTFFNYSNTNMFSFRHYLSFFLVPNQYFLVCFAHWIFIRFSKIFNSSNVNEVIRAISNLFIFFTKRFYTHQRHKKHTTHTSKQK